MNRKRKKKIPNIYLNSLLSFGFQQCIKPWGSMNMKRTSQIQFWAQPPATNKYLQRTSNHLMDTWSQKDRIINLNSSISVPLMGKGLTSDLASSIEEAIASKAALPSTNHWAWLPSSVIPLGGAKEPKRWGWHQPSGGLSPASLIAATQSLTLAPVLVLNLMLRTPQVTFGSFQLLVRGWIFLEPFMRYTILPANQLHHKFNK